MGKDISNIIQILAAIFFAIALSWFVIETKNRLADLEIQNYVLQQSVQRLAREIDPPYMGGGHEDDGILTCPPLVPQDYQARSY